MHPLAGTALVELLFCTAAPGLCAQGFADELAAKAVEPTGAAVAGDGTATLVDAQGFGAGGTAVAERVEAEADAHGFDE